jgi:hypothetical protein
MESGAAEKTRIGLALANAEFNSERNYTHIRAQLASM